MICCLLFLFSISFETLINLTPYLCTCVLSFIIFCLFVFLFPTNSCVLSHSHSSKHTILCHYRQLIVYQNITLTLFSRSLFAYIDDFFFIVEMALLFSVATPPPFCWCLWPSNDSTVSLAYLIFCVSYSKFIMHIEIRSICWHFVLDTRIKLLCNCLGGALFHISFAQQLHRERKKKEQIEANQLITTSSSRFVVRDGHMKKRTKHGKCFARFQRTWTDEFAFESALFRWIGVRVESALKPKYFAFFFSSFFSCAKRKW